MVDCLFPLEAETHAIFKVYGNISKALDCVSDFLPGGVSEKNCYRISVRMGIKLRLQPYYHNHLPP